MKYARKLATELVMNHEKSVDNVYKKYLTNYLTYVFDRIDLSGYEDYFFDENTIFLGNKAVSDARKRICFDKYENANPLFINEGNMRYIMNQAQKLIEYASSQIKTFVDKVYGYEYAKCEYDEFEYDRFEIGA